MATSFTAARTLMSPAAEIFAVLADPAEHRHLDATGMVLGPVTAGRIEGAGQVFTMNMTYEDGEQVEHYRTDNHVVVWSPPTAIGWATATAGSPPLGWTWRYDLQTVADGTKTRLTYDWSRTPEESRRRFGVPLVGPDDLAETLRRLAERMNSDA